MEQARIVVSLVTKEDKIKKINLKDIVKALGRSGYVALPKELVGKYVEIKLKVLDVPEYSNKFEQIKNGRTRNRTRRKTRRI